MGSNALHLAFDVDYKYEWTGGCVYYCIEIFFLDMFGNVYGEEHWQQGNVVYQEI